jgi:large subunit ribosomal protein L19
MYCPTAFRVPTKLSKVFFKKLYTLNFSPYLCRPLKIKTMSAIAFVHEQLTKTVNHPSFKAGDNVTVNYKIVEGNKERIQSFKGDVIKRQGTGSTATFTVRKISDGVGVERLFPVFSPNIESIVVNKVGRVRRAKLFFLRERSGKSARIKEKRMAVGTKTKKDKI